MKCRRKNCFAYDPKKDNHCHALSDNSFRGKPCPFYMDYKEMAEEVKKYDRVNQYSDIDRGTL